MTLVLTNRAWQSAPLHVLILLACALPAWSQQTQRQYLSGTDKDNTVPWDFLCTAGRNSGQWTKIPVPSNWEFQGFGNFTYGRDNRSKPVESGQYRHDFTVPSDWKSRRIFIVFEASMTDTTVTINGQSAGPKHQGGFYRFKYDITNLVKFGQPNKLEVTVDKLSSDETVNRAERQSDYWVFGGIFRPVYLEAVPQEHIDHIAIDAKADGSIAVDVYPQGIESADNITARIVEEKDWKPFSAPLEPGREPFRLRGPLEGGREPFRLRARYDNVRTWTSETPNLYTLEVSLRKGNQVLHQITKRFGFRTVEFRPSDGLYINGVRIMLKGVCRHSFWPDTGRTLSRKISEMDVALMKDMNMNAVRMSHYPPDDHFLDVCDEQGLYVLDELGGWQKSYGTEVGKKLVKELVERDVNHPSIIIWDNGNEGGWNTALDSEFAKYDPQNRQVIHPWGVMGPTNTKHYPDWSTLNRLLNEDKVFFPTEFLHGLYDGGAGAGLADYWDAMRKSKVSAGGFIWALVDEGAKRGDLNNKIDVAGNLAPDGIVGPYREKEGSFYTIKQIWSPVVIDAAANWGYPWSCRIENRYDFTSLDQHTFKWQLLDSGDIGEGKLTVVAEGKLPSPRTSEDKPVLPGEHGWIEPFRIPAEKEADILRISAEDPSGRVVCERTYPFGRSIFGPSIKTLMFTMTQALIFRTPASGMEEGDAIVLHGEDTVAKISKQTGQLLSIAHNGRELPLKNGPRLVVGNAKLREIQHHQEIGEVMPLHFWPFGSLSISYPGGYSVQAQYTGDMKSVTWTMHGSGCLELKYEFTASGPQPYLGVTFDWPESKMKKVQWLGQGPYRVWKNRMQGPQFGLWENEYNDTLAGYQTWKFPEFRGYFGPAIWLKLSSDETAMTVILHGAFARLGTDPKITDKRAAYMKAEPLFPPGDISFLYAIPPIGNKFHSPNVLGPSSELTDASGPYQDVHARREWMNLPRTYEGMLFFRFE